MYSWLYMYICGLWFCLRGPLTGKNYLCWRLAPLGIIGAQSRALKPLNTVARLDGFQGTHDMNFHDKKTKLYRRIQLHGA